MSMLSAQRDELRWLADNLEEHDSHMDEYVQAMRSAADTIWELRNKMCGMVDARERARVLEADNAKLRELCAEMFEAVKCCCGEWCTKTASNCDNNECGWHKCYVALRELGIEVDE